MRSESLTRFAAMPRLSVQAAPATPSSTRALDCHGNGIGLRNSVYVHCVYCVYCLYCVYSARPRDQT